MLLLDRLALTVAVFEQAHIGLDMGIAGVLGLSVLELLLRPRVIAAQHIRKALIVEDFRRRANDADGLFVGAVGEIEAVQPVVGRREPDPGLGVARMFFRGAAKAFLGEAEIVAAEILLAELQVVLGVAA